MKKKVKLDLEVLELEAKIAPKECQCGLAEFGQVTISGAEC